MKIVLGLVVFSIFQIILAAVIDDNLVVNNGDVVVNNGVITCNGNTCPENTYKCTIKQYSLPKFNNSYVDTISKCIDYNGQILSQNSDPKENMEFGRPINRYTSVNIYGDTTACDDCSNSSEAQEMAKQTVAAVNSRVNRELQQVYKETNNLGQRIRERVMEELIAEGL